MAATGDVNVPAPEIAVLDRAHLARYTLGDARLEAEILGLFAGQLPKLLGALTSAANEADWLMAAHSLKGSAKAIGATNLAKAAEAAEKTGFNPTPDERLPIVDSIELAASEALRAISQATS